MGTINLYLCNNIYVELTTVNFQAVNKEKVISGFFVTACKAVLFYVEDLNCVGLFVDLLYSC